VAELVTSRILIKLVSFPTVRFLSVSFNVHSLFTHSFLFFNYVLCISNGFGRSWIGVREGSIYGLLSGSRKPRGLTGFQGINIAGFEFGCQIDVSSLFKQTTGS